MSKAFSRRTLGVFEDASASIPLRQLDRAFQAAAIRLGEDPGGSDGTRRVQFRRYVGSVDQADPQQLDRLGDVLGALIEEVATSKQEFLVAAAARDGFIFEDGAFRPGGTVTNERGRAAAKPATIALDARYSRAQDAIVIRLDTGATFTVPRLRVPGFERIAPVALRKIQIKPPGDVLWFDAADRGVRLETLMIAAVGEGMVRKAAEQLSSRRESARKPPS